MENLIPLPLNQAQRKLLLNDQRAAAKIVSEVLLELEYLTKPGVKLDMLDEIAERMILDLGGEPENKGYKPSWAETPFPATVCMSVNEEACHGIPGGRELVEGDIINYDLGVRYGRGCGDAALSVAVGESSNRKSRLMRYAKKALYDAIRTVKAGVPISMIGKAVEANCYMYGYSIIKEFGGHHIGREMHEEPHISHYYNPKDDDVLLKEGAVICIEPIMTPGTGKLGLAPDGWTHFTLDEQPVAMFEHMLLVCQDGVEILTTHISE